MERNANVPLFGLTPQRVVELTRELKPDLEADLPRFELPEGSELSQAVDPARRYWLEAGLACCHEPDPHAEEVAWRVAGVLGPHDPPPPKDYGLATEEARRRLAREGDLIADGILAQPYPLWTLFRVEGERAWLLATARPTTSPGGAALPLAWELARPRVRDPKLAALSPLAQKLVPALLLHMIVRRENRFAGEVPPEALREAIGYAAEVFYQERPLGEAFEGLLEGCVPLRVQERLDELGLRPAIWVEPLPEAIELAREAPADALRFAAVPWSANPAFARAVREGPPEGALERLLAAASAAHRIRLGLFFEAVRRRSPGHRAYLVPPAPNNKHPYRLLLGVLAPPNLPVLMN